VACCCECGDEPSGSCATELVSYILYIYICTICITCAYICIYIYIYIYIGGGLGP
jgi:hypothetical protein